MEAIILNSCSKINIGLNILDKRADGYHNLETIFYPIKLCDTISFTKSDRFRFLGGSSPLTENPDNLIIRAKNKIEAFTGIRVNAEIFLTKYIPIGGGLGGGSSNAACTLRGLNLLYNLNISDNDLSTLALELGSDVPFFIKNQPCYGTGRGENLEMIDFHIPYPILVVNPRIHISTSWAFKNLQPSVKATPILEILKKKIPVEDFKANFRNDFEAVVFNHYPEIYTIKETMYSSGALFSSLSGSGSTVYGIFKRYKDAREIQLKFNNYLTFIHHEKH